MCLRIRVSVKLTLLTVSGYLPISMSVFSAGLHSRHTGSPTPTHSHSQEELSSSSSSDESEDDAMEVDHSKLHQKKAAKHDFIRSEEVHDSTLLKQYNIFTLMQLCKFIIYFTGSLSMRT